MLPKRAAILVQTGNIHSVFVKRQSKMCLRHCQKQGYQISKQHFYQLEGRSFDSDAPQLVQLRLQAVLDQFDVLVITWSGLIGPLPLWRSHTTARAIHDFYSHNVRIESVMPRHGLHDLHQQMLMDAIYLAQYIDAKQMKHNSPYKKYDQNKE